MSHYAEVIGGIVQRVIVAEQEFIDSGAVGNPANWVQTSYNMRGGIHQAGGVPLRKNYAGPGFAYDPSLDAFIPPQPYPSWTLNQSTCLWEPPVPIPETGTWRWDEPAGTWVDAR